jgi:hypothetical protein
LKALFTFEPQSLLKELGNLSLFFFKRFNLSDKSLVGCDFFSKVHISNKGATSPLVIQVFFSSDFPQKERIAPLFARYAPKNGQSRHFEVALAMKVKIDKSYGERLCQSRS